MSIESSLKLSEKLRRFWPPARNGDCTLDPNRPELGNARPTRAWPGMELA